MAPVHQTDNASTGEGSSADSLRVRCQQVLGPLGVPPLTEAEAEAWAAEGCSDVVVLNWVTRGFRHPDDRPDGMGVADLRVLDDLGIREYSAGWAGARWVCQPTLRALAKAGKPAEDVMALTRALTVAAQREALAVHPGRRLWGPLRECDQHGCWGTHPVLAAACGRSISRRGRDLDWGDLAACLTVRMGLFEAMTYLRSGQDMTAIRVMAALTDPEPEKGRG